jgi:hypothetical protein
MRERHGSGSRNPWPVVGSDAAVAILDIGRMHDGVHQKAQGIDRICPSLPLIFLAAS